MWRGEGGQRRQNRPWSQLSKKKGDPRIEVSNLHVGPDQGKCGFPEGWLESLESGSEHNQGSAEQRHNRKEVGQTTQDSDKT